MSVDEVTRSWSETFPVAALVIAVAWFAARHTPDRMDLAPYLPRSVAALEACRTVALAEYPGQVARVSSRVANGRLLLRLTIAADDNGERVTICDGVSGARLRTIDLDQESTAQDALK